MVCRICQLKAIATSPNSVLWKIKNIWWIKYIPPHSTGESPSSFCCFRAGHLWKHQGGTSIIFIELKLLNLSFNFLKSLKSLICKRKTEATFKIKGLWNWVSVADDLREAALQLSDGSTKWQWKMSFADPFSVDRDCSVKLRNVSNIFRLILCFECRLVLIFIFRIFSDI